MILSEFAGAAQSLYGATLVNPWDVDLMADSILNALNMSFEVRNQNMMRLKQYVNKFTATFWGLDFVEKLSVFYFKLYLGER